MVSNIPVNMGYNSNPFIVRPLNKTREDGMSVECSTPITEFPDEFMNNLNSIKAADSDGNNIISFNELQNLEEKTEFAQTILEIMEKYAQNFQYKNYNT